MTIAITGGTVVPVTSDMIENGVVIIEGNKIKAVGGSDTKIPDGATIIDASGKWVTPGFIDAHSHISTMNEPQAMPSALSSQDGNEMISPNTCYIRAIDALNPADPAVETARKAGFTTCCTLPGSANIIGGTSIVFKTLKGSTIFDLVIEGSEQMKMALGENPKRVYGNDKKAPMTRMGNAAVLREALYNAKVYADAIKEGKKDPSKAPKPDFKLDPLVPVIEGKMRCRIHSHRADDIVTAIRICKEFGLKFSIEHCTEGYKILDYLKANDVTAIVGPLTMGPMKMEIWGTKLETPGLMEGAGVNFCLTEDSASGIKYLPTHIGYAIARGLSRKAAFEAVTIRPAKLLDVDKRVGSLEKGKDADVAIFTDFPFSNLALCDTTIINGEVYKNLD
ncbi:MAG: amidohydrolase [Erysipelotrichaceae bacterium]|jgi:imidazolonepropionase-like amidohydrolase|nr:amidohydrolase [Erysipelotrichaceae bacterium]